MTTQYLHKPVYASLLDECSSWLEQALVRAADWVVGLRNRDILKTQFQRFGRRTDSHLRDIGLDDPQAQLALFGDFIDSREQGRSLEQLRNRLQIQR